jgi:hypothetical protein
MEWSKTLTQARMQPYFSAVVFLSRSPKHQFAGSAIRNQP